jgi:hypothetical protein
MVDARSRCEQVRHGGRSLADAQRITIVDIQVGQRRVEPDRLDRRGSAEHEIEHTLAGGPQFKAPAGIAPGENDSAVLYGKDSGRTDALGMFTRAGDAGRVIARVAEPRVLAPWSGRSFHGNRCGVMKQENGKH